jgi:hypothetical protein
VELLQKIKKRMGELGRRAEGGKKKRQIFLQINETQVRRYEGVK